MFLIRFFVRNSHYSYELRNNKLRIFPSPVTGGPNKMWVEFAVSTDAWEEDESFDVGVDGINNFNTLPFANIPYQNINSMGKQWIRQYALAVAKGILGQVRSKIDSIPLPKGSVRLNGESLMTQAKEQQDALRKELIEKHVVYQN